MKKKQASLKDIANEIGVSIATVSYVLSKREDSRVSPEMSDKIRKVAKKLNYQPNIIAQSLKSGRTNTIGLILADISNPFFAHLARIIEEEATRLNYTVIFGSSNENSEKSMHLIDFLLGRQVDGFIISPSYRAEKQIVDLNEKQVPFVLIDRYFPEIPTNYVIIDNYLASSSMVEELVSKGNKRIGMIAYANFLHHMEERVRGYRSVLEKNNLEFQTDWLHEVDFAQSEQQVKSAIDTMLSGKRPVDSIFFATNSLAIHGLRYLGTLNLKVPDDIAIISFDEGEAFDFYYCPLTHIRQPLEEIGQQAVQVLVNQIEHPDSKRQQICLKADLVIGKSSGANS